MGRSDLKDIGEQVRKTSKKSVENDDIKLSKDASALVPSGCAAIDVAGSETSHGAWHLGTMVNIVGDTTTGKSVQALTGLIECAADKRFDDHRLIYDDTEGANNIINMSALFPSKLLERIEAPRPGEDFPWSDTVEAFQANFYAALKEGPFIYVMDSLDGLSATAEVERVHNDAKRHLKGDDKETGSFKTEKARKLSEMLRVFYRDLIKTDSLLINISQVRENFNAGMFEPKHRRNGGKALDHYCQQIVWLFKGKTGGQHKKTIRGQSRTVGNAVRAKFTKNRLTGRYPRGVSYDIFPSYGIDSIGSMVDWMVSEDIWKGSGKNIKTDFHDLGGSRKEIIAAIEEKKLEKKLKRRMAKEWQALEELLNIDRTRKF